MRYQVAIIGAGVVGSLLARELTRYELSVALIEAREDVAVGASSANSAIVHGGFDPVPGTLKAKLNVRGLEMMPSVAAELGVHYRNNGSLVLAFSEKEMRTVEELYERGLRNGAPGLSVIGKEELHRLEPNVSENAVGALRSTAAGLVCSYGLAIAAAGNAADNGAELFLSSPVTAIRREEDGFVLQAGGREIRAEYVVNAAGVYADEIAGMISDHSLRIRPRKGEYLLFDQTEGDLCSHTLFQVPSDVGKGILVTPTVHGNLMIGPTSVYMDAYAKDNRDTTAAGLEYVKQTALCSVGSLNFRQIITSFTGIRAVPDSGDFVIRFAKGNPHFLHLAGIESPGLTASPAIAEYAVGLLAEAGLRLTPNRKFCGERRPYTWFRDLSAEKQNEVIAVDPRFGHMICRCEKVTEGEIIDAIHRVPEARTLDAVKRRIRATMGRCQGGFCSPLITELLAREWGIGMDRICKNRTGSELLVGRTKEDKA